jgi:T4 RnlA family RNA ligase
MDKVDGSLISTWIDQHGKLQLKSKTSLTSDQVQMAWKVIKADPGVNFAGGHMGFEELLLECTTNGVTVNMEYIGPDNQIVIGYAEPALRVLNWRDRESGEYEFAMHYWDQHPFFLWAAGSMPVGFDLKSLDDKQGVEGVVVVLQSGEWFKLKTPWYAALHKTKDSINSPRKLFECIVTEAADDLKAMFHADPISIAKIEEMEKKIVWQYLNVIRVVCEYYNANKDLDRKSYAIKGQERLPRELFSLAMTKYLGREVDFKEWAIKHYEYFGVKDDVVATED